MIYKVTILGKLPGLNEIIGANRGKWYSGAKLKQETDTTCKFCMLKLPILQPPIDLVFDWYEPNKKRDKDNISAGKKFILDALVELKRLPNDGWNEIGAMADRFHVDKENPRVEVTIYDQKG